MTYTVTQEDRDATDALRNAFAKGGLGDLTRASVNREYSLVTRAFARHRIETLERAAEVADAKFSDDGWNPHYQNASSAIAAAIRALKGKSDE